MLRGVAVLLVLSAVPAFYVANVLAWTTHAGTMCLEYDQGCTPWALRWSYRAGWTSAGLGALAALLPRRFMTPDDGRRLWLVTLQGTALAVMGLLVIVYY